MIITIHLNANGSLTKHQKDKANELGINHMDYWIAMTCPCDKNMMPTEAGAINGGLLKRDETTRFIELYFFIEKIINISPL